MSNGEELQRPEQRIRRNEQSIAFLRERIDELNRAIVGNPEYGLVGMNGRLDRLERRLDAIVEALDRISLNQQAAALARRNVWRAVAVAAAVSAAAGLAVIIQAISGLW